MKHKEILEHLKCGGLLCRMPVSRARLRHAWRLEGAATIAGPLADSGAQGPGGHPA